MKKTFEIFAIFCMTIMPAIGASNDCKNATRILIDKYCMNGADGGTGGDCCSNDPKKYISFNCAFFKDSATPEAVKQDIKQLCGLESTDHIDLIQGRPLQNIPWNGNQQNQGNSSKSETPMNRDAANADYAGQLGDENNWKTVTVEPSDPAPKSESTATASTPQFIAISGTVFDDSEKPQPLIGATVCPVHNPDNNNCATVDIDGNFSIAKFPANEKVVIEFAGYEQITMDPSAKMNIVMTTPRAIEAVEKVVQRCYFDESTGIAAQVRNDKNICITSKCHEPRWKLSGTDTSAKCVEQKCTVENGRGEWISIDNKWVCGVTADSCKNGYKPNADSTACIEMLRECADADRKKLESAGAASTGLKRGTETCVATECKCGYDLKNDACIKWSNNKPCDNTSKPALPKNARSGIMKCNGATAICEIKSCNDGFRHDTASNTCIDKNKQPCTDHGDKNAASAFYENRRGKQTCVIITCKTGYAPNSDGTKCEPKNVLSAEDQQKKIAELQDNAQKMKDKEQSTENKLLGAAGIGATGIGGMMLASGLAEQSADADAESAMRAYLATFHCNYGGGKNVAGGTTDVELPGGNELIGLYAEYVNLANDLKSRKEQLGLRPGIESEAILESATSGLYDDVAVGKTSGAYVSLARALMNPDGEDAKMWAEQTDKTAQQIKTGAITAGVGAAGSLIGNLAINSGKNKQNKVDEILNKYNKLKKPFDQLSNDISKTTPETKSCPAGTKGSQHPNCTCNDESKIYNPNTLQCESCSGGQTVQGNECKCPADKFFNSQTNSCEPLYAECTPKCQPGEGDHMKIDKQTCECSCTNGFTMVDNKCVCTGENMETIGDQCVVVKKEITTIEKVLNSATNTVTNETVLPASNLFKIGSYELLPDAKSALDKFVSSLNSDGLSNCKLEIIGYTDPVGSVNTNQELSTKRAQSVENHIKEKMRTTKSITSTLARGMGENNCYCGIKTDNINSSDPDYSACSGKDSKYPITGNTRYAPCRRVEIRATCQQTTTTVVKDTLQNVVNGATDALTSKK